MIDKFTIRFQAQGSGIEKSIVISQNTPVNSELAIAGLEALKKQLNKAELKFREHAFAQAVQYIRNVATAGGIGPHRKPFTNKGISANVARIDIEILRGHNLNS